MTRWLCRTDRSRFLLCVSSIPGGLHPEPRPQSRNLVCVGSLSAVVKLGSCAPSRECVSSRSQPSMLSWPELADVAGQRFPLPRVKGQNIPVPVVVCRVCRGLSRSYPSFHLSKRRGCRLSRGKDADRDRWRAAEKGWSEAVEIVNLEMCGSWRATAGLLGSSLPVSSRGRVTLKRCDQRRPAAAGARRLLADT